MLHVKDEVNMNLPVVPRGFSSLAEVLEGLVLVKLGDLEGSRVLPLGVPIALVKLDCMVVIPWDLITILIARRHAVRSELGLVNHAEELLITLGYALELFPTIKV